MRPGRKREQEKGNTMIAKKISIVALSSLTAVLACSAMAQDTTSSTSSSTTTTTTGNMTGTMTDSTSMSGDMSGGMSTSMSMQPMPVSGTVLRYYTDRSGYVTAMDVQTAEGVRMVRFSPGMAQRLYSTYPVGGQITGTVQPSMAMGMTRYDLVGMGDTAPAAGMMQPYTVSDVELLRADPFITAGSRMTQFRGKLQSVVTDDRGEILGLVLQDISPAGILGGMSGGMAGGTMASTTGSMDASGTMAGGTMTGSMDASGTMAGGTGMMGGMMGGQNTVLVRVPRELRHNTGMQMAGSERVTPLFKGADVGVVGYNESPRYGVVSNYGGRVAASALVVNGRAVGAVGLPMMTTGSGSTLLPINIGGTTEEQSARNMGYMTYSPDGGLGTSANTTDPAMTTGTTGTTSGM